MGRRSHGRTPPADGDVRVVGRVVAGHGAASGRMDDPRFPDGTLVCQWPAFAAVDDLPIGGLHRATVNVATTPRRVRLSTPRWTIHELRWHRDVPAESFSFVACRATVGAGRTVSGLLYQPHPGTKPAHHHAADVVELLLPWCREVHPGAVVWIDLPDAEVRIEDLDDAK